MPRMIATPRERVRVPSRAVYSIPKSHVSELKNWIPKHLKKKKPCVRVGLRAGGDFHWSEKPVWSAGDTG